MGWLTSVRAGLLIPFAVIACGSTASDGAGQASAGSAGLAGTGTSSAGGDSGGSGGATSAGGSGLAGGSGGSSTAGGTSGESGSSSAAGTDGAAGSSGGPLGSITIYSMVFNGSQSPLLSVVFPATSSGAATSTCTSTPYGSCAVTDCMASSSTTTTPTTTTRLSAGTINVDSDAANVHLSATPDANGNYTQVLDTSAIQFRGGEAFTVTGTGAAIPSFTTSSTYPLLLIMTGPPPPTGVSQVAVNVPRSAPATLTWQRGASGGYLVVQTNGSVPSGTHSLSLYCQVDSLPGTATIPTEALSAFPSGTELELYTVSQSRIQAGTQGINIWAVGDTITADKMARVELMLE